MIKNPEDIMGYSNTELTALCEELRRKIYETVMKCGGHLASNLGAVEPIVALFHTFDFPKDKIIFDVGHQCYAYKLLSGREDRFDTLRKAGGISGFPKRRESIFDCYDTGHAGTSVSAAIGIAKARDLKKEDYEVIAFIGDGSFNNGLIYEALNSLKILNTRILIILNDNGMSISRTVGGMHEMLDSAKAGERAEALKLLEGFGLRYMGVVNGNDVGETAQALAEAKEYLKTQSVLLHIATKKGKGYEFCEEHPDDTHGIAPVGTPKQKEYSEVLGQTLSTLAETRPEITVVTAAMTGALGLDRFFALYPERSFDVGICEENASVLCAAMASAGLKPYYAIYSTFLQRAFDEIIHDVGGQDLPVTFCVDRAGISGADGETHQGVFDLSYLSMIPSLAVACPKDTEEFAKMLKFSADFPHPLAIRYPRAGKVVFKGDGEEIKPGKWEYLKKTNGAKATILAVGERCLTIAMELFTAFKEQGKAVDVINARFVKPIDEALLSGLTSESVVTVEDNVFLGGFGEHIAAFYSDFDNKNGTRHTVKSFAYRDEFIPQGGVAYLQKEYGVDKDEIKNWLSERL